VFLAGSCALAFFLRQTDNNLTDSQRKGTLVVGIVTASLWVLFNLALCCFWKQVKVAIAVIDATADFMAATKRIVFTPVLYFFVTLIVFIAWFAGAGCVLSLNTITASTTDVQGKDIVFSDKVNWMLFFMIFGLIWLVLWIQDKTGFICMVAASSYYFTSNKDKEGSASVSLGYKLGYFKHGGSLAFGALVHAIVTIVRQIVEAISDQTERAAGNVLTKLITCCARCLVRCLECCIEFINRGAYAYMAVSGDSYCTSAWNGFLLHLKHNAKFSFAQIIAWMFVFMGKIMITGINCTCYWLISKYATKNLDAVGDIWGPIIIIALSTYITTQIFLSMFDEATLATLTCLAIDQDLNEGKPAHGPPTFHEKIEAIYAGEHGAKGAKYK